MIRKFFAAALGTMAILASLASPALAYCDPDNIAGTWAFTAGWRNCGGIVLNSNGTASGNCYTASGGPFAYSGTWSVNVASCTFSLRMSGPAGTVRVLADGAFDTIQNASALVLLKDLGGMNYVNVNVEVNPQLGVGFTNAPGVDSQDIHTRLPYTMFKTQS